jgi:hypothetical protein
MLTPFFGSTPPSPGTPSSSSYLSNLSAQSGIPLTGGGGYGQSNNDPYIYMGSQNIGRNTNATVAEHIIANGGSVQGSLMSDLQRKFIQSNEANRRHWAYLLALTGYAGGDLAADPKKAAEFAKTVPLNEVLDMHNKFLQDAADQFNLYRRKITPTGLMKEMLSFRFGDKFNGNLKSINIDSAGSLGSALDSQAGTHTMTQKSVDFMSPEDAKGLVRGVLQQQLGRDPTQAEYEDFLATIHGAERANPSTSTTTYTTDAQGNTTNQSTTSKGGLNQSGYDQLLYDKAKSMPSWAIWQAVGTYAPALFAALDSPVQGA